MLIEEKYGACLLRVLVLLRCGFVVVWLLFGVRVSVPHWCLRDCLQLVTRLLLLSIRWSVWSQIAPCIRVSTVAAACGATCCAVVHLKGAVCLSRVCHK